MGSGAPRKSAARRRMKFSAHVGCPGPCAEISGRAVVGGTRPFCDAPASQNRERKREECTHAQKDDPEESCIRHGAAAVLRGVPAGRTALYPHLPHQGGGPGRAGGELLCRPAPAGEGLHTGGVADLLAGGGGGPGPAESTLYAYRNMARCHVLPGPEGSSGGADAPAYPGLSL